MVGRADRRGKRLAVRRCTVQPRCRAEVGACRSCADGREDLSRQGPTELTVRLRAHHLLCMLTFVGEGYSPAFTENYRSIARRLSAGEEIELVSGPDDICAPLMEGADPHCLKASVIDRDAAAA